MQRRPAPKIEAWTPTPEEQREFEEGDKTQEWLHKLPANALEPYHGKWIAAKGCEIIASAPTHEQLMAAIGDKDSPCVVIEFVRVPRSKGVVYIY